MPRRLVSWVWGVLLCGLAGCYASAAPDMGEGNDETSWPDTGGGDDETSWPDAGAGGTNPCGQAVDAGFCDKVQYCEEEIPAAEGPHERVTAAFEERYAEREGLTYAELLEAHRPPYIESLGFDPVAAAFRQKFIEAFGLSNEAIGVLDDLGFVVVPVAPRDPTPTNPLPTGAGPSEIYHRVWTADLPVFVSADSILHAWHRTFDNLLVVAEERVAIPALRELVVRVLGELDPREPADRDAMLLVSVGRKLLEPSWAPPGEVADEVATWVGLAEGLAEGAGIVCVPFLGGQLKMDFSQFIPRGHYTRSEALKRYFKAMLWFGRTDLVLDASGSVPVTDCDDPNPREEAAARALVRALRDGCAGEIYRRMDRIYGTFVGRTNALTPTALLAACAAVGRPGCVGEPDDFAAMYDALPRAAYSSRVFGGDTPPLTLRFFPQRFAYDAWVTARSTTPRLQPAWIGGRAMAMPEDVAFVLGSDRAAEYFAKDMEDPLRENLPATLAALRDVMEEIAPSELEGSIYNHWLDGLAALSRPGLSWDLPEVMRTAPWHDRKLEAVLASWAELRHDTILIVEQSTGGIDGCVYPDGYVEPVPGLWKALGEAAVTMSRLFKDLAIPSVSPALFGHWVWVLDHLAQITERELAGQPLTDDQALFLNDLVSDASEWGCGASGARVFDGWYPNLFWQEFWPLSAKGDLGIDSISGMAEPLVIDVHTDAENEAALEVATSNPALMVVAIERSGDVTLYGGPVSSYFTFRKPIGERMTDEQWAEQVEQDALPASPPFTAAYRVE
ncbi:MAG: DUF3160 domain-containing protein [Deltaproteobacteria bacterium]|nr:DUF3160 domain-containing protein [Deltaproteobacteria bacterium]